MKRPIVTVTALALVALASTSASAQDWRGYGWQGYGWNRGDGGDGDDLGPAAYAVCSGARAHQLEAAIRHEADEGDIDRDTARYLHRMVDHTESDQRRACRDQNGWAIRDIAQRYNWIGGQLHQQEQAGYNW